MYETSELFRLPVSKLGECVVKLVDNSPFLHYLLVPRLHIINNRNTGNQSSPPPKGCWLPVLPILITLSREPVDNSKMVNRDI